MGKIIKGIFITVGIIVVLCTLLLISSCSIMVYRTQNYWKYAETGGGIEAKYTKLGAYEVSFAEFEANNDTYKKYEIWYPSEIKNTNKKYPLVIMANGTGVKASQYKEVFKHLSSWGFIVAGNEDDNSRTGASSSATLDFILSLNDDSNSEFYQKIDTANVGIGGHSQGGVIASMTAGILTERSEKPTGLVLIAPGSVIQDACRNGKFFGARFDPADPPEFIKCFGVMKLGRDYILSTQELDIYGTAGKYDGPVRLIHGDKDSIVPMSCSEKYMETYGDRSELIVVKGGNHMITRRKKAIVAHAVAFFDGLF